METYNGLKAGDYVKVKNAPKVTPTYRVSKVHSRIIVDLTYQAGGKTYSGGTIDAGLLIKQKS